MLLYQIAATIILALIVAAIFELFIDGIRILFSWFSYDR